MAKSRKKKAATKAKPATKKIRTDPTIPDDPPEDPTPPASPALTKGKGRKKTPPKAAASAKSTASAAAKSPTTTSDGALIDASAGGDKSVAHSAPMSAIQVNNTGSGASQLGHDELTRASTNASTNTFKYHGLAGTNNNYEHLRETVRNFVAKHFFPCVKFITKKSKLAYHSADFNPKSFCAVVTTGCNLPPNVDVATWWEVLAKKEVAKKISQLRADRLTSLKWNYYGTYLTN